MEPTSEQLDRALNPRARRLELATRLKQAPDVQLPRLEYWNYGACERHDTPEVGCIYRACGGDLLRHQRIGVAWLYAVGKGLVADETGTGKTLCALGLIALLKQRGELARAIIVCKTPAVEQWYRETLRWTSGVAVGEVTSGMNRQQRIGRYAGGWWDVLILGYHMLMRDVDLLTRLNANLVIGDDVDPLRNPENATARAFTRLARNAERVVVMNATPLHIKLQELYANLVPLGAVEMFGSLRAFERRYVRQEMVKGWGKGGRRFTRYETVGYKNMDELKQRIEPLVIRRRAEDSDDLRMPIVMPPADHWLELHPPQREKYRELQRGILRILKEQGEEVRYADALAKFTYGAEICAGLPALGEPDGPQASVKLDWLMDKLQGDFADRKVVVFSRFKGTILALRGRMRRLGLKLAVVVGGHEATRAGLREREIERFWTEDDCRVLVGTTAIESSINLQVSNTLVNIDLLQNPQRMYQILGRIKRTDSRFQHVYVHNLLTRSTQEERYLEILEQRQAVADYVWNEEGDLFEQLSPVELLSLIRP